MTDTDEDTEVNEIGLDLSWRSDLKTVWATLSDAYAAPASDAPSSTAPSGVTVGGTTADDLGSETTTFLPRRAQDADLTETQRRILETASLRPTATKRELAAVAGASAQYVATVCGRWLPEHPAGTAAETASSPAAPGRNESQSTLDDWGGQTRGEQP